MLIQWQAEDESITDPCVVPQSHKSHFDLGVPPVMQLSDYRRSYWSATPPKAAANPYAIFDR